MVRKIFGFLNRETGTLNQAAILLGFFAFLSQVLAFLRDRLLAHIFGASSELDIYYAAFRVPDFIFVAVASVVSLSVLIPFIVEKDVQGREVLREFINDIFSFFSILIILVSGLAYLLMPNIAGVLFKNFSVFALDQVVFISRILLLSPIILGLSNLFGSLTQAYNRFTLYALAPILYNAGIIIGIILLAKRLGIMGVAIGVIFGALLHALVQVPFILKLGLFPRFSPKLNFSLISQVAKISLPRTLTLSISSVAMIFLVSFASLMPTGSVSILSLSFNLQAVLISTIGVSYSLAAFPTLSRYFRESNFKAFLEQTATTARFILFWALPLSALFIVLRAQIVRVVLGSGLFDWNDTRLTAAALALFVLSSAFQCLGLLFVRGFYSAGFTKTPLVINLVSTAIMFSGTWGLVKVFYASEGFRYFISALLKVEDLPGTAVLMLPLGFSVATVLNGLFLWIMFEKRFKGFSNGVVRTLFESFSVSVIMGAVAYLGLKILAPVLNTDSFIGIFFQGLGAGLFALVIGIVTLILLKNKELSDVWTVARGKFWRTKIIATDSEIV